MTSVKSSRRSAVAAVAKALGCELMTRAQSVINSLDQIGVLSSLLGEGKLEQFRMAVEAAEREHDARLRIAERKRLR